MISAPLFIATEPAVILISPALPIPPDRTSFITTAPDEALKELVLTVILPALPEALAITCW